MDVVVVGLLSLSPDGGFRRGPKCADQDGQPLPCSPSMAEVPLQSTGQCGTRSAVRWTTAARALKGLV